MPWNTSRTVLFLAPATILAIIFSPDPVWAHTPYPLEWVKPVNNPAKSNESYSVAVGPEDNLYVAGFDWGTINGESQGYDIALTKLDSTGTALWSKRISSEVHDYGYSVAVDSWGNAVIAGYTDNSSNNSEDLVIAKFGPDGDELWSKQMSSGLNTSATSVAVDNAGNIYLTGETNGVFFDVNYGSKDAFLIKFDPLGNELLTKQFGTHWVDGANAIAIDSVGNIYISGETHGPLGGPMIGPQDIFLTKMNPSGSEIWSRQIGTTTTDDFPEITIDNQDEIYLSFASQGLLNEPGYQSNKDAYLLKYDSSGNRLWSQQIGTPNTEFAGKVGTDKYGNVYLSGTTEGDLHGNTSAGSRDIFVSSYDAAGNFRWTQQIGSTDRDWGADVAADSVGHIYVTGITVGDLDGHISSGFNTSAILLKLTAPIPGDLDGDGFVGIADLTIVLDNWNEVITQSSHLADPSGDGFVGIDDLNIILSNWNTGTPPGDSLNIPEPMSLVFLMVGGVGWVARRS